ncbi:MAG TPA: hypothetical protein VE956_13845 [Nodularia sp. (in: cyanobacteria)]|nr:hypothetical protein [Nodularia sp. (in: cyanobacteria)]
MNKSEQALATRSRGYTDKSDLGLKPFVSLSPHRRTFLREAVTRHVCVVAISNRPKF